MKTITGIHGVPRSGTSWLSQIFNASPFVSFKFQPLFSYAFKDYLNESSTAVEIEDFFRKIYISDDYFINMRDPNLHKNYPDFNKETNLPHLVFKHVRYHYLIEHLLRKNESIKFILIIRNPIGVLSSWKNAPREFNPEWDFDQEWKMAQLKNQFKKEEYFGYQKWKEATQLFIDMKEKYPERVALTYYSTLLEDTEHEIKRLFNFSGIPMHPQVENFIYESKNRTVADTNAVYRIKSKDDNWKGQINTKIVDAIFKDLKGTDLEKYIQ